MGSSFQAPGKKISPDGLAVTRSQQTREIDAESGIRILKEPILWIYEGHGAWFVEKHQWVPQWVPGLPSSDFRCEYATAEAAVEKVLRFFSDVGS
jgi:hypothetical protein